MTRGKFRVRRLRESGHLWMGKTHRTSWPFEKRPNPLPPFELSKSTASRAYTLTWMAKELIGCHVRMGEKRKRIKSATNLLLNPLSYFLEELTAAAISNFLSSATGCLWNSRASAAAAASWLWKPYNSTSTHLRHPLHVTPASSFLLILLLEFSPPDRKWGCLTSCKLSSDSSTYLFRVDPVKNRREEKEDGSCE